MYVNILNACWTNAVVCFQAFIAIEKGFFELINDSLAEKYNLMMQIPAVCLFFVNIYKHAFIYVFLKNFGCPLVTHTHTLI